VKGGAQPDDPHGVDAISGGTITSKGLEAMLKNCLVKYEDYFINNRN
jgi:Na+-transporting NADH:ubiquinone oxidoreductase subunit C